MSSQRELQRLVIAWTTGVGLAIFLVSFPAMAQRNSGDHIFLIASGFLCDSGDSSACPAVTKANQGDTYELSGAGMFDAQSKSVKAAGTFTHKSPNGNVLETGVWLANELASFDSYGVAPNALPRQGMAFGPAAIGPRRMLMGRGPMPTGGLAVFRIQLLPMSGLSTTAVLQVNCALGDVPRERSVEGIRLKLERSNSEYSEEINGRVMFLAMTPGMSAPVRAPQEEKTPENSEQPHD
ncbi:MAG TPA: hypothetical protein VEI54_09995 [Candidatus Limnocylindrales bacterium]|nr:hypothetical protein [Candidatus Limnocylindrales bacterium]